MLTQIKKSDKNIDLVSITHNLITDNNINFMKLPGWEKDNMFMEIYFEKLPTDIQLYIFKQIKHWKKPTVQKFNNFETALYIKYYYKHVDNSCLIPCKNILDYLMNIVKVLSYHEWDYVNKKWIYTCSYKKTLRKIDENDLWKLQTDIFNKLNLEHIN